MISVTEDIAQRSQNRLRSSMLIVVLLKSVPVQYSGLIVDTEDS